MAEPWVDPALLTYPLCWWTGAGWGHWGTPNFVTFLHIVTWQSGNRTPTLPFWEWNSLKHKQENSKHCASGSGISKRRFYLSDTPAADTSASASAKVCDSPINNWVQKKKHQVGIIKQASALKCMPLFINLGFLLGNTSSTIKMVIDYEFWQKFKFFWRLRWSQVAQPPGTWEPGLCFEPGAQLSVWCIFLGLGTAGKGWISDCEVTEADIKSQQGRTAL